MSGSPFAAPGEPPPPAPRRVPAGVSGWNTNFALLWGGGYGGIPAVVLVFMLVFMGPPWNDTTLDRRGVTTEASPYAVENTGVEVNDESLKRVRVRFRDRAGRQNDVGLSTIDGALIEQARKREPVAIDYDPQDPSLARFHGRKASVLTEDAGWVVPMLLVVFVVPGLSAFFWGLFSLARRRGLYRNGAPVLATVVEHTQSASSENDEYLINARYQYPTARGMCSGVIKSLTPPPVGAQIWVLYSPDSPEKSVPALWPRPASG